MFCTSSSPVEVIDSMALIGSPISMIAIFVIYLLIVFKIGPNFMQHRPAFKLTNITRAYNAMQIFFCVYFVVRFCSCGVTFAYLWKCGTVPKTSDEITPSMMEFYNLYWYFMMLRLSEFLETIIFVLRKKQNQVTVLHVYHHIAVVSLLWLYLKYNSGEIS